MEGANLFEDVDPQNWLVMFYASFSYLENYGLMLNKEMLPPDK